MNAIYVAGTDEVGRGPLAGSVTAASLVFPPAYKNPKITDSKKLSPKKRDALFDEIKTEAVAYSIVSVGPRRIEKINIREASRLAMKLSLERVEKKISGKIHVLIDGNTGLETNLPQETIIKGDSKIISIAGASILAKVARDRLMELLEEKYPGYGFKGHKGYPTKTHREAIKEIGPSLAHRRTFSGVSQFI